MFEVYADEACTQRPVAGQSYTDIYLKINAGNGIVPAIELGDSGYVSYGSRDGGLSVSYPTEATSGDLTVSYCIDFLFDVPDSAWLDRTDGIIHLVTEDSTEVSNEFSFGRSL